MQLPNKFKVGKCNSCNLVQLTPRPTIDDYEKHYKESQYYSVEDYDKRAVERTHIFKARLDAIDTYIDRKDGQVLLDFGCAGGHFLVEAKKRGWKTIGVEYTDKLANNSRKFLGDIIYKEASEIIKKDIKVDIAHSNHVFEYLPDPLTTAKDIYNILKPDGVIFVEVPYQFGSWLDIIKLSTIKVLGEKNSFRIFKGSVDSLHHTFFILLKP